MDDNIVELQEAIAYQGDDISHLSKELYTQQKEIAELREQITILKAKFDSITEDNVDINIGEEPPPPHY